MCAEAEFAEFASDRIGDELFVVGFDDRGVAAEEFGFLDAAAGDMHEADRAVLVAHGKLSGSAGRHIINLACWEVRHIWLVTATEAVAFLRLLAAELKMERVGFSIEEKIDFHPIRVCHAEAHFFGINAHIVVTHRETCAEDGLVYPMKRGAPEAVLFGKGGEWCRGRVGRDAENDVVVRVNILLQTDHASLGRVGLIGEVKVAAACDLVGIHLAATEPEFRQCAVAEWFIEELHGVFLNREFCIF